MAAPVIATIGYEGSGLASFLAALRAGGVDTVLDVREVTSSRKPGFSKTRLAAALAEQGIGYRHFRELGTPKAGRVAAHAGRVSEMAAIYHDVLFGEAGQRALAQVAAAARGGKCCLLCYERDPSQCHRNIIGGELALQGFTVEHLFAAPV